MNFSYWSRYGVLPLGVALLGAIAILLLHGIDWIGAAAASGLLLAGWAGGLALRKQLAEARQIDIGYDADECMDERRAEIAEFLRGLDQLESTVTSRWVRQIENGRRQTEQALLELNGRFPVLMQRLDEAVQASRLAAGPDAHGEVMRISSEGIRAEINEILVLLQFQDRVSQIFSHVRDNINAFPAYMQQSVRVCLEQGRLQAIDWSGLLQELEQSYSTAEEQLMHRAKAETAKPEAGSETTFF